METSQQISEKAHALFLVYGIRSVTMDQIAASLGISKKTIYKYFENKDALVKKVVVNTTNESISLYNGLKNSRVDAIMDLFTVMKLNLSMRLKFSPEMMLDLEKFHPAAYALFNDHQNQFIYQAIEDALQNGIRQRLFTADFNIHAMARFFLESIATVVSVLSTNPENSSRSEDVQKEIFGHMINGIATFDGVELIGRYRNEHELLLLLKPGNHMFFNA